MNLKGAADESDESEEDLAEISRLDELLLTYDPNFDEKDIYDENREFRETIISHMAYGADGYNHDDIAQRHQLRLNVERARVPEVLFQPSIIGIDQAGLIETIEEFLSRLDIKTRNSVSQNIFLTGSHFKYSGILERIQREIRMITPFEQTFQVKMANDLSLDSWKGAARWATKESKDFYKVSVNRKEYEECGGDYLKEHRFSNIL
jgi:actin-related protein 5